MYRSVENTLYVIVYRGIATGTRNLYIHELQHKTKAIVQIRIYIFGSSSIRRSNCSTKCTTKVSLLPSLIR